MERNGGEGRGGSVNGEETNAKKGKELFGGLLVR